MSSERPPALSLTVRNFSALPNGAPLTLVLDRRSATIGRASSTDWSLPDPELHISGRHCDILFRNGGYELVDNSTNGTFLNADAQRLNGPRLLHEGDVIRIGKYEIGVHLGTGFDGEASPWPSPATPAAPPPAKAASPWPAPAEPQAAPPAPPPPPSPAPAHMPPPLGDDDIWNKFAASNAIDWERGGFGTPPPPPAPRPFSPFASPPTPEAPPAEGQHDAAPAAAPAPTVGAEQALEAFLAGAEMPADAIRQDPAYALHQAGALLRKLVAGMVVMLEARARAKSQMGAQGTGLEISGNNPLKFARNPDQALRHVLNPPERGFMDADRAVEDGWKDLQAHQLATLRAMQGALRSTLDRFSPKSIRSRAETRGMLEKILPGARDAAMWKAYEREFSGVAFDSDEAFMDMFAKEFRKAYDAITRGE